MRASSAALAASDLWSWRLPPPAADAAVPSRSPPPLITFTRCLCPVKQGTRERDRIHLHHAYLPGTIRRCRTGSADAGAVNSLAADHQFGTRGQRPAVVRAESRGVVPPAAVASGGRSTTGVEPRPIA